MDPVDDAAPAPISVTKEQFVREAKTRAKLWVLGVAVSVLPGIRDVISSLREGNYTASPVTAAICSIAAITAIGFYDLMRLRGYINKDKVVGFGTGYFLGISSITALSSGVSSLFFPHGLQGLPHGILISLWILGMPSCILGELWLAIEHRQWDAINMGVDNV